MARYSRFLKNGRGFFSKLLNKRVAQRVVYAICRGGAYCCMECGQYGGILRVRRDFRHAVARSAVIMATCVPKEKNMLLSCECDRHYAPTPLHVLPHLAKRLRLDEHSRVLSISTEGDIAPDRCEEIVWLGRNG